MRKAIQKMEEENELLKKAFEELECKLDKLQEAYDKCNWLNEKQCSMIEGAEKRIIDLLSKIEKLNKVIRILTNILDLKVNEDYQAIEVSNCFNFYVEIEEDYEFLKEVLGDD